MEISDLLVFKAVVEHNGITRAAQALHRVPSNVTARIKKLESELRTELFLREGNRLSVNSAGLRLLDYTDKILQLQKAAIAELTQAEPSGLLRLGSMESSAAARLPSVLACFHNRYEKVQIELTTDASSPLVEKVLTGDLDVVMAADPPDDPRLLKTPCYEEELVLILPASWLSQSTLPETLTMVGYHKGCSYRQRLEAWLKRNDRVCEKIIEMPSHYTMLGCVIAGMGVGMVPRSVLALHRNEGLAVKEVDADIALSTTYLVSRRDNPSSAITAFIECALDRV